MIKEEFVLFELNQKAKFEYAFMSIIIGSLVLSINYSSRYSSNYAEILFLTWFSYIIALLVGSIRIYKISQFQNLNELDVIQFIIAESSKNTFDGNTFENLKKKRNILREKLKILFWIQVISFFIGIILNTLFVSMVYLNKNQTKSKDSISINQEISQTGVPLVKVQKSTLRSLNVKEKAVSYLK